VRNLNQDTITQAVIARFANTPDPRLKEIMTCLVQHLHAFAREVKLTEQEWLQGIQFLTATGHKCDDKRQEFILLSDVLGLSMLTVAMNNDKPAGCTEATVFGPFHVEGAPRYAHGDDVANGAQGEPCLVRGSVSGIGGEPVPGAVIEVWTCSTRVWTGTRRAVCWSPARTAASISAPSWPRPTRSPPTGRSAACWRRRGATRGGPRTCIS
jgi:hydroxyquinol 1,2-dioxygenase